MAVNELAAEAQAERDSRAATRAVNEEVMANRRQKSGQSGRATNFSIA